MLAKEVKMFQFLKGKVQHNKSFVGFFLNLCFNS